MKQLVECSAPDTLSWRPPCSAPHTETHTHTHTHKAQYWAHSCYYYYCCCCCYTSWREGCVLHRVFSPVSPWVSLFLSFNFLSYAVFFISSIQMCSLRCKKFISMILTLVKLINPEWISARQWMGHLDKPC